MDLPKNIKQILTDIESVSSGGAIAYLKMYKEGKVNSGSGGLQSSFLWDVTIQGDKFWRDIAHTIERKKRGS